MVGVFTFNIEGIRKRLTFINIVKKEFTCLSSLTVVNIGWSRSIEAAVWPMFTMFCGGTKR